MLESSVASTAASEIQRRISALATMAYIDLSTEMQSLKKALLENPSACSLLMDEDIGILVKNLRRITGTAQVAASTKPAKDKKASSKKLTALELAAALDDM